MPPLTFADPLEVYLKHFFGYNAFRPDQKEVVEGILSGKDLLAILPTGAGKSIGYQLPALLYPGTAVVISPLISLMQDQVSALTKNGIPAAYINSSLDISELRQIFGNLHSYKMLYIAPERLNDEYFLKRLKSMYVSFIVIDEAHCISQWGHSFRPDYRELSKIKTLFPSCPIMALTATATQEVQKDILQQLAMQNPLVIKGSFDRPNLMIRIDRKVSAINQIKKFLLKHEGKAGIIYAATRKNVELIYERLQEEGYSVGRYHAGMSDSERQTALHEFIYDKTPIMVATVAFGMGINKPDVRFIVHHDMPQSVEQYYQEIGRAGRDGLLAECLMLYASQDLFIYRSFLSDIADPLFRKQTELKMSAMYSICQSSRCRRHSLLRYFGQSYSKQQCQSCDQCIDDIKSFDGTIIAQKILSCVYRLNQQCNADYVIKVLKGAKNPLITAHEHDKLSTYNLMPEYTEAQLLFYIETLLEMKLLVTANDRSKALMWSDTSREITSGRKRVEFHEKIHKEKIQALPAGCNKQLFERLKSLRSEISRKEGVPAFCVFSDRSLIEMATSRPKNTHDFADIFGVGRFKQEAYGMQFMRVIKQFCS